MMSNSGPAMTQRQLRERGEEFFGLKGESIWQVQSLDIVHSLWSGESLKSDKMSV